MTSRLTPAAKDFVTDLQADPMSDFSDFKEKLLDCCGLTAAQAGFTYHELKVKDLKMRTTAQVIQWITRLLEQISRGAKSIEEFSIRLGTTRIRTFMSSLGKQFIDSRCIDTIQQLRDTLLTWETTEGSLFPEEHPKVCSKQTSKTPGGFTCFKCGKPAHRAAECRMTQTTPGMMQQDKTHPKCFTCGVVGHKSPDCPSKVVVKKEPE